MAASFTGKPHDEESYDVWDDHLFAVFTKRVQQLQTRLKVTFCGF